MIELFGSMYSAPTPMIRPMFNVDQLATTLFAMGFEQEFIQTCKYIGWDFKWLFPSLYDGSFFGRYTDGKRTGQEYLRGFATFLCGAFVQHPSLRTNLNDRFEKGLLGDGYRFDGKVLNEVDADTSAPAELSELEGKDSLLRQASSLLENDVPVAMIFLDLDHFKQVNDQLSHTKGNECLVTVVQTISKTLLRKGKLYRVGGDEFCCVLPNFGTEEAAATAERIRKSIHALKPVSGKVKVTVSVGVAASDRGDLSDANALFDAADSAMYVVKWTTKNRVSVWPPNAEEAASADANRKQAVHAAKSGR
jgi:diguanylate cyclase (GGDEF)-like protein